MTRFPDLDVPIDLLQTPPCPHFEDCGACQLQHLKSGYYRELKEEWVRKLIEDNGLSPISWKPSSFVLAGTRRRVTFSAMRDGDNLVVGFHRYHEHTISPVEKCLLLTPALSKVYYALKTALLPLLQRGSQVDILLQEADGGSVDCVITGLIERDTTKLGAKQTAMVAELANLCNLRRVSFRKDEMTISETQIELEKLTKTSGALRVELSAGAFLQPSAEGENFLCQAVIDGLPKLGKRDKVLDLFSGCGTFAGRIAEKCNVHAVEIEWGMSNSLKLAAKGNSRLTAEVRDLFKEPMSVRELRGYSACVFDPPRAGAKEQCQKLAKSDVPVIIAVSCNPSTFARDAKILTEGGYELQSLQLIDQFLYTTHTELVGVFTR